MFIKIIQTFLKRGGWSQGRKTNQIKYTTDFFPLSHTWGEPQVLADQQTVYHTHGKRKHVLHEDETGELDGAPGGYHSTCRGTQAKYLEASVFETKYNGNNS